MFDPTTLSARWQVLVFAVGSATAVWGLLALLPFRLGGRGFRGLVVGTAFLLPAAWVLDPGLR